MDLKDKIKSELHKVYGKFETVLEIEYEARITQSLLTGDTKNKEEWVTYNQVILELKNNIKNMLIVKQLQYELTNDTNPNEVCIGVLQSLKFKTEELDRLYYKIINF